MLSASLKVQIAFGETWNTSSTGWTWTDVTNKVRGGQVTSGRDHEFGEFGAGHASIVLDNSTGGFEPLNTLSPYSPNVKPNVPIRVQIVYGGTTKSIWSGFVEQWPMTYRDGIDGTVSVKAVDGFKHLELAAVTGTMSTQGEAEQIGEVLNAIGWPANQRDLNASVTVNAGGYAPNRESALSVIRLAADSAGGEVFMSSSGFVAFRDRRYLQGSTAKASFSNTATGLDYSDLQMSYDDEQVWNEVVWDIEHGVTGSTRPLHSHTLTANDTGSQDTYGVRTMRFANMITNTSGEGLDAANSIVYKYKDPLLRVRSLSIRPEKDAANLWPQVRDRALLDKIHVTFTPPRSGGDQVSQRCFVERITHQFRPGDWTTTWSLSPDSKEDGFWLLGSTGYSEVGQTTVVGY